MIEPFVYVRNSSDLFEDVNKYKGIFPSSFTSIGDIEERLQERVNDPVGSVFGIQVSNKCEDRCYGFEVDMVTPKTTTFIYVGIWKT